MLLAAEGVDLIPSVDGDKNSSNGPPDFGPGPLLAVAENQEPIA